MKMYARAAGIPVSVRAGPLVTGPSAARRGPAGPAGARRGTGERRSAGRWAARSGAARVLLLCLLLAAIGTLTIFLAQREPAPPVGQLHIPWWAFAPFVMAAEGLMFHVEAKRETHSFNFSEIPLVVGFFFASPVGLLAGRLTGHLGYRLLVRRQAPIKMLFNSCAFAAETGLAMVSFRALAPHLTPLQPVSWLAIVLAVTAADATSMVAVTSAIRWTGGDAVIRSVVMTAMTTTVVNSTLAILTAVILWASPWALTFLALVVLSFSVLYRRYLGLNQRYAGLETLYGFAKLIEASFKAEAVTEEVLAEARKLLRAGRAEMVLIDESTGKVTGRLNSQEQPGGGFDRPLVDGLTDEPVWKRVSSGQEPVLIARSSREPDELACLERLGASDCMIAPLVSEGRIVGAIMVADRQGSVRSFDDADLKLFATLANHASVAFENGRLVDRLRCEADERRFEALHDGLTGLANRAMFAQRVALLQEDEQAGEPRPAAVMLMDLDRFKEVNDTLGHHNGDALLIEVANRLRATIRKGDLVARLGGDEFAILLSADQSADEVMATASRIVAALDRPFELEGLRVDVGASIGIATFPEHGYDAAALLQRADVAMYQAKSGDEPIVFYSPDRDHNTRERLTLAADLRRALHQDEFEVVYQPKARLADGGVVGAEALLRWRHPTRGFIGPAEFIPVAEQIGIITPITLMVLRSALEQCRSWASEGHELSVAVNLSLRSLLDAEMPHQVETLLVASGVPSHNLTLEITESSIMADPPRTIAVLERLTNLGVRLSVDDFGTGYSSLSYLRRLPIHEVKIDKTFLLGIDTSPADAALVKSIIDLSHNLGLRTVAEGVEDRTSWDLLREMGCDEVQGFYLSTPMASSVMAKWLATPGGGAPVKSMPLVRARTVLVVDDDLIVRQVVAQLFDAEGGYQVHQAAGAEEAIAMARGLQPDAIILDLNMPKMHGIEALPKLRAVAPHSRVVVLSGSDGGRAARRTSQLGAWAFVDKAVGLESLPQQVLSALGV